jgi:hypothetical protein
VQYTDDGQVDSDSAYSSRPVIDVATGDNYVLRRVISSARPETGSDPYDLLHNEIRIGLHLIRMLAGAGRYPRELSRLLGYNDRDDKPYLLLSERGRPLGQLPVSMPADSVILADLEAIAFLNLVHLSFPMPRGTTVEKFLGWLPTRKIKKQLRFQASLMRALALLDMAGVVHRRLDASTVRWDDPFAQVADFRHATLAGEPRSPVSVGSWAAPEAHSKGIAAPPEDMWSAGLLITYLLTTRPPTQDGRPPDVSGEIGVDLKHIRDVFDASPQTRPRPTAILDRLGQSSLDLSVFQPIRDPDFDEGCQDFEAMRTNKAQRYPVPPSPAPAPSPSSPSPASPLEGSPPPRPGQPTESSAPHDHAASDYYFAPPGIRAPRPYGSRRRVRRTAEADTGAFPLKRMTSGHAVRCYTCQDAFTWAAGIPLFYQRVDGEYEPLPPMQGIDERKRRDARLDAWVRCPNPSGDMEEEHYLPAAYGSFGPPLAIGLIGASNTGKSHLLAAMIRQIQKDGLAAVGLRTRPANLELHRRYVARYVDRLFRQGEDLGRTAGTEEDGFSLDDAFLVDDGRRSRAVAFFDVLGEPLIRGSRSMRFILAMDALIFVVDPEMATGVRGQGKADRVGDLAFETVLRRFAEQRDAFTIPIAVAISKCDKIKFEHPVADWICRPELAAYSARESARPPDEIIRHIIDESRDAYAYLHKYEEARPWLRPVNEFRQATLHFVSATGGSPTHVMRADGDLSLFPAVSGPGAFSTHWPRSSR